MPRNWKKNQTIYLFKQKNDIMKYGNHRRIKLIEHKLKIIKRLLERLREVVRI